MATCRSQDPVPLDSNPEFVPQISMHVVAVCFWGLVDFLRELGQQVELISS